MVTHSVQLILQWYLGSSLANPRSTNKAQDFRVGIFPERCGIGIKLLALRFLKLINILKIRRHFGLPLLLASRLGLTRHSLQRTFEQHFESQCSPMQAGKNKIVNRFILRSEEVGSTKNRHDPGFCQTSANFASPTWICIASFLVF